MKQRIVLILLLALPLMSIFAQQKYALVIGNANYTGISKLNNPTNDANDMALTLQNLGFTVDKIIDGDLEKMETAVINLKKKLGASRNSYGFFFYAGHGVQANGQNYLIPLPATNIQNETHLRDRAVSLQFVLDSLSEAGNELNMIVLDACRDNPFGWSRSGARGLSVVSQTPSGSIVMYAAASGQKADDGTGRNGLFTGYLLKNMKTTGLSVYEVFDKTMGDVKNVTGGKQDPELSLRFSGANAVYLGQRPMYIVDVPMTTPVYDINPSDVVPPPPTSSVPDGLLYQIIDGKTVSVSGYSGNATILSIPEKIQGLTVNCIEFRAFSGNDSLTNIIIPSTVKTISDMSFSTSINFKSITVDSRNLYYTSVDGVLFDKNIRTIIAYPAGKTTGTYNIPSTVTAVGNNAFFCSNLTNINIPSTVTSIGDSAFSGSQHLTSITVDTRNTFYASVDGVLFNKNMKNIIVYPAGKTIGTYNIPSSVTSIEDYAFVECNNLTSVTIPSSITTIGLGAFRFCRNLTSISIPSSVTTIGSGAFWGCVKLTSISIPSSVTTIGHAAFFNCDSLTSVTLSRNTQVGDNVFPSSAKITYR